MPRALIEPGARIARRAWFASRQLYEWRDQHEALQEARWAYGLTSDGRRPDEPDPRELLRDLTSNATPIRPRRSTERRLP